MAKIIKSKGIDWTGVLTALLHTLFFGVVVWPVILVKDGAPSDYPVHIATAQTMLDTMHIQSPHFLFQIVILFVNWILMHPGLVIAAYISSLLFNFSFVLIVYAWVRSTLGPPSEKAWPLAMLASLLIATVTPVTVFSWTSEKIYQGFLYLNSYHNPTLTCLKPLAAMIFYLIVREFDKADGKNGPKTSHLGTFGLFLLTAASVVAKPNLVICLLPALSLFMALRFLLEKKRVPWIYLGLGVFLPSLIVLLAQFRFSYGQGSDSGIIFAPLYVFSLHSTHLLMKFLLSILFPGLFTILFWKEEKTNTGLRLAWLIFFFGAFYTYFLAESGPRMGAGNFAWSGQISQTLLYMVTISLFAKHVLLWFRARDFSGFMKMRVYLCLGILPLNLISGLLWAYVHITKQSVYFG